MKGWVVVIAVLYVTVVDLNGKRTRPIYPLLQMPLFVLHSRREALELFGPILDIDQLSCVHFGIRLYHEKAFAVGMEIEIGIIVWRRKIFAFEEKPRGSG